MVTKRDRKINLFGPPHSWGYAIEIFRAEMDKALKADGSIPSEDPEVNLLFELAESSIFLGVAALHCLDNDVKVDWGGKEREEILDTFLLFIRNMQSKVTTLNTPSRTT